MLTIGLEDVSWISGVLLILYGVDYIGHDALMIALGVTLIVYGVAITIGTIVHRGSSQ